MRCRRITMVEASHLNVPAYLVQRCQNHREGRDSNHESDCAIKPLLRQCRRHSVASKRSVPTRLRSTVSVRFAELKTLSTSAHIAALFPKFDPTPDMAHGPVVFGSSVSRR
jgi:hypothetical protein